LIVDSQFSTAFQKQHLLELKKREKEYGDKTKRFLSHQSDIKQEYK